MLDELITLADEEFYITDDVQNFLNETNPSFYQDSFITAYQSNKLYDQQFYTFDSETTQIKRLVKEAKGKKEAEYEISAKPILFQLHTEDTTLILRNSAEMVETFRKLSARTQKRTIIYVHNLTFDIYFLLDKMLDEIGKTFIVRGKIAKLEYKKLEFRCSFLLTRMGLANFIKSHGLHKDFQKTTDWDYNIIRSEFYKLEKKELLYSAVDVIGLYKALESECRLYDLNIAELPLTTTGYVRRDFNKKIIALKESRVTNKQRALRKQIGSLKLPPMLYPLALECYRGGISGTNPIFKDQYIEDVYTVDLSSQYPSAQVMFTFPMSTPKLVRMTEQDLVNVSKERHRGFLCEITIHDLEIREGYHMPNLIKYEGKENDIGVIENGSRIYSAKKITVSVNDVDFFIMTKMYSYSKIDVKVSAMFRKDYLPKEIVQYILTQYHGKTVYKDVVGKEKEYTLAKIRLNSIYGMTAQNPINTEYTLDEKGIHQVGKIDMNTIIDTLDKYNKATRSTYFLWGQYTTSYGHLLLYEGMKICGADLICCDTDSLKMKKKKEYIDKFEELNKTICRRLEFVSKWHGIDIDMFMPRSPDGEQRPLGIWCCEDYDHEKGNVVGIISKRAKSYITKYEKGRKITFAGMHASKLEEYLQSLVDEGKFNSVEEAFSHDFTVPADKSGKLTHLYKNEQQFIPFTDAQGHSDHIDNRYAVTLQEAPYKYTDRELQSNLLDLLEMVTTHEYI